MPARRRSAAAPVAVERVRALPASGLLDWTDPSHWSEQARPCRYCGALTHLQDAKGPADKVCVEERLAEIDRIVSVYAAQVPTSGGLAC